MVVDCKIRGTVVEVAAVAGKVEAKVVVEKVDAKVEAVAAVRTEREVKAAGGGGGLGGGGKGVKKAEGDGGLEGGGGMAAEVAVEGVAAGEEVNMEVLTVGAKEVAEAEVKVEALGTVRRRAGRQHGRERGRDRWRWR